MTTSHKAKWQKSLIQMSACGELAEDNTRLTAENERLRSENSQTYCAYCGQAFVRDDGAASLVGEHIRTCEKHPMRAVETELKWARETENELSAEIESLTEKNQRISKTNLRMLGINASLREKNERLRKALEKCKAVHEYDGADASLEVGIIVDAALRGDS